MNEAVIVARVSTEEQKEANNSLPAQKHRLENYCRRKDLKIKKTFEIDESAYKKTRTKFDTVVDYILKNNVIACFDKVDRLTRNIFDKRIALLYEKAIKGDIELHFVSDNQVIGPGISAGERFSFGIQLNLANYYSNAISDNVNRTFEEKIRRGEILTKAPYGYKNARDINDNALVIVVEFEAGIVKEIYNLYTTEAHSYSSIAEKISKEHGIKMYRRKVEHIIKNKFYHGLIKYRGKEYPHKYEKILDKEIYDMAKDIREGRTKSKKKGKMKGKYGVYRGLIYCAECGCVLSPSLNRHARAGKKVQSKCYYYCTNARGIHKTKPQGTNDTNLDTLFAGLMEKIQIPESELGCLVKALNESHEGKKEFTETELNRCNREIKKKEAMLENAYEDKCAGSITQKEYDKFRKKWRDEQYKHERKIKQILEADEGYYVTATYLLKIASRAKELFLGSEPEEKRVLIQTTLQNLRMKDGLLLYDWKKPFDSIAKSKECNTWGG